MGETKATKESVGSNLQEARKVFDRWVESLNLPPEFEPSETRVQQILDQLHRMIAAELHFHSAMLASRELFGKSYFSLGQTEKIAVDQAVTGFVGSNYRDITPEFLATPELRQPAGFGIPKDQASPTPSTPQQSGGA